MDDYENLITAAFVRTFINKHKPWEMRLNVTHKIIIPSKEGDYSCFDILIMVESQADKVKILELIKNIPVKYKIGVACI